jgi:hypothetical protein
VILNPVDEGFMAGCLHRQRHMIPPLLIHPIGLERSKMSGDGELRAFPPSRQ